MVELQFKIGDIVRIKTLTEIVLANPAYTVHGVVTVDSKNSKFSIAPGDKLSINGNEYSYGMYEQGGRIGEIIALLPRTMVVDVARTGEYNYCYHPDWLELYDKAKEAILSKEIMNLI